MYVGVSKPPNILVVSERRESISQWRKLLWNALSRESYVIYELEKQDLGKDLWKPYTSLLILDHVEELDGDQKVSLENYFHEGGKTLCHCSIYLNIDEDGFSWRSRPWDELLPVSCRYNTHQGSVCLTAMVKKHKEGLQSEFRFSLNLVILRFEDIKSFKCSFKKYSKVLEVDNDSGNSSEGYQRSCNIFVVYSLALLNNTNE